MKSSLNGDNAPPTLNSQFSESGSSIFGSQNLNLCTSPTTNNDRITRFASPNRFHSLDAPSSFLDNRSTRSRSTQRSIADRIIHTSDSSGQHSCGGSVSSSNASDRLAAIGDRLQRMKQERNEEQQRSQQLLLKHQIGLVNEVKSPPGNGKVKTKSSRRNPSEEVSQLEMIAPAQMHTTALQPRIHIDSAAVQDHLSDSQVNSFFTPAQQSTPSKDALLDSKARICIKSDTSTQAKTLTYREGHSDTIDSRADPDLAQRLDEIACQMGLIPAPKSSPRQPVCDGRIEPLTMDKQETSPSQPATPTTHKRGRSSIFTSLLRRLSPRLKRRSKSFSPSRGSSGSTLDTPPANEPTPASSVASTPSNPFVRFFSKRRGRTASGNRKVPIINGIPTSQSIDVIASSGQGSSLNGEGSGPTTPQRDVSGHSRESSSTNPSLSATVSPDGRRLLEAIERDRVADPYAQFKRTRGASKAHSPVAMTPGGQTNGKMTTPVRVTGDGSSPSSSLSDGPSRPHNLEINLDSTNFQVEGTAKSPRYLNVALSAFGYSNCYGRSTQASPLNGTSPREPTTSDQSPLRPSDPPTEAIQPSQSPVSKATEPSIEPQPAPQSEQPLAPSLSKPEGEHPAPLPPQSCSSPSEERKSSYSSTSPPESPLENGQEEGRKRASSSAYRSTCSQKERVGSLKMRRKRRTTKFRTLSGDEATLCHIETQSTCDDSLENRLRNSLIMLTVSHSSPRGHHTVPKRLAGHLSLDSSYSGETAESPRVVLARRQTSPPSMTVQVDPKQLTPVPDSSPEKKVDTPASEEVQENGVLNGGHFLGMVQATEMDLRGLIEVADGDLVAEGETLPEEVSGIIRAAVGKANLLIAEKFAQFRDLCEQNLSQPTNEYVTLTSDLEGFWAMVLLQVEDIKGLFREVDQLRSNQWRKPESPSPSRHVTPSKPSRTRSSGSSRPSTGRSKVNDDTARAAAKRRLQAVRREALTKMKHQQSVDNSGDNFVNFV